jgi:hypothetical protein
MSAQCSRVCQHARSLYLCLSSAMPPNVNALHRFEAFIEQQGVRRTRAGVSVLVAAIAIAAQAGILGSGAFRVQVIASLSTVAFLPLTKFYPLTCHPLTLASAAVLSCLAYIPASYELVKELMFGHTREGAQWYDALWRIYSILGLWIVVAVVNEAKVRPFLRARSEAAARAATTPEVVKNTVASRAEAMRRAEREKRLAEIRERTSVTLKQKKDAETALAQFDATAAAAKKNVVSARAMAAKAEKALAECNATDTSTRASLEEDIASATSLAEGAVAHEMGLNAQKAAHSLILGEASQRLKDLQDRWAAALNWDNYPFYR